jgi:site-specific DNA-cytosine methylase
MKTILSLFDFSGRWSDPYRNNGYHVIQIDSKLDFDILDFDVSLLDNVYGILAAPPCTDFAGSGAQYWKAKDEDGRTAYSLSLVDKVIELVEYYDPTFWVIENPVGRLTKLRPGLGKPWYFNPNEFAGYLDAPDSDQYTKKTGLWGKFNKPIKKELPAINGNSPIMKLGGKSEKTKELRSMTPRGFALAFYEANK